METIAGNIYDFPVYYDLVFGADWAAEFHFLTDCFEKHVSGRTRRLFEPACGTGRLLYRFAKEGYALGGIDLNPKAIEYYLLMILLKKERSKRSVFAKGEVSWIWSMRMHALCHDHWGREIASD